MIYQPVTPLTSYQVTMVPQARTIFCNSVSEFSIVTHKEFEADCEADCAALYLSKRPHGRK
jgi:hypothetical protein